MRHVGVRLNTEYLRGTDVQTPGISCAGTARETTWEKGSGPRRVASAECPFRMVTWSGERRDSTTWLATFGNEQTQRACSWGLLERRPRSQRACCEQLVVRPDELQHHDWFPLRQAQGDTEHEAMTRTNPPNPFPVDRLATQRAAEVAAVLSLVTGNIGQSAAILGEPRSGKTSLLRHLAPDAGLGGRAGLLVAHVDAHTFDAAFDGAPFWTAVLGPFEQRASSSRRRTHPREPPTASAAKEGFATEAVEQLSERDRRDGPAASW